MSGYDLPMSEINDSGTGIPRPPGHPEFGETRRRMHDRPRGQGVGKSVGISVATKMAAARFNTDEHKIFDQHVTVCAATATCRRASPPRRARWPGIGPRYLIYIYDSNAVTLDARRRKRRAKTPTNAWRHTAFDVQEIDGTTCNSFSMR